MKYFVNQLQKDDCGCACAKMMVAKYQKDINYLVLPFSQSNTNFKSMQLFLKQNGINSYGVSVFEIERIKKFKFVISQIIEQGKHHFVIFERYFLGNVIIYDPMIGKRVMNFKQFINLSTGYFLIFDKLIEKKKEVKQKLNSRILNVIFQISLLLDGFILYISTFLVGDINNIIYLIGLFFIAFINYFAKILIILSSQNSIFNKLIKDKSKIDKKLLNEVEYIKKYHVEKNFKTLGYIYAFILLFTILLFNSKYNLIFILIDYIFVFIKKYFFDYPSLIYIEKIKQIDNLNNFYTFEEYQKIKKNSIVVMLINVLYNFIMIIAMILCSVFIAHIDKLSSIPYLLFIFFTNYSIIQILNKMIVNFIESRRMLNVHLSRYNLFK